MSYTVFARHAVTGGHSQAMDGIDGARLTGNEKCLVVMDTGFVVYAIDLSSGAAEAYPDVIAPDINPGTKRWILVPQLSMGSLRKVYNLTAASFTLTDAYHGVAIDCFSGSGQAVTIDALDQSHNGAEMVISKLGAGDVVINAPAGVTFGPTDNRLTLKSPGYECRLRYNHTRSMLIVSYAGIMTGETV